jgi:aspartyl-tRNA(Asn)/glutamyl-tRNA(Gln) amidotransferase subunit A
MTDTALHEQTITSLSRQIREGNLSPVALTEHLLSRIEALNGPLHAFNLVVADRAMIEAQASEAQVKAGLDIGPLHGIPYAVKDIFDVGGLPTTAGSRTLGENIPARDGTVTRRLREAGMIVLGKTITVEFAKGIAGINHIQGTPHNPWHAVPHIPGGSSAGSAVAVASGMAPMALGSDTGGSVRAPASLCGIVGLKTTVGRVSRHGVFPLSWTMD